MSNEASPLEYPHFVTERWGGRLPTPTKYRGTPMAKSFETGRIGGKKIVDQRRVKDTSSGRCELQQLVRRLRDTEVFYVRGHTHARQRIGTAILFGPGFIQNGLPGD